MVKFVIKLLIKLALLIIERYSVPIPVLRQAPHVDAAWLNLYNIGKEDAISPTVRPLLASAAECCLSEESNHKHQSGEWKHHTVLAKMMKKHPTASQRDICMAMELSLPPRVK